MGHFCRSTGLVCAALLLTLSSILIPSPVMALSINQSRIPIALGAMSNKAKATAKDVEGKLESAYGDLTDDKGHQLKGKVKQGQASAMNAAEDIKDAAKTMKKKIKDAAEPVSDELS
jgi:uncharacterized protein YjbJ (UPF0337 family)